MAWTVPQTWTALMQVGATALNTQLRDNLNALKTPPFAATAFNDSANAPYSTTATTFTAINTATLSLALTTNGGAVLSYVAAHMNHSGTFGLDLTYSASGGGYNSAVIGGTWGAARMGSGQYFRSMMLWIQNLASGTYTFRPIWRSDGATNTAFMASSGETVHFWVREVS